MSKDELIEAIRSRSVNVLRDSNGIIHKLIWSPIDSTGYICVIDPANGAIITIIHALHPGGYPCVMNGDKSGEAGIFSIKKSHLEQAMRLSGIEPLSMDDPDSPAFYKEKYKKPRAWNYRWGLRFLTKDGVRTKNLGREEFFPDVNKPPESVMENAKEIVRTLCGWDACVYLIDRDGTEVIEEWKL